MAKKINKKRQDRARTLHVQNDPSGSFTIALTRSKIVLTRSWTYAKDLLNKMEDDDQDGTVEVINDEEDDNEDGVLMDTPIGPEAVLIGTSAVPQLAQDADDAQFAQDADDDALCFHCTECNLTLASSNVGS